MAINPFKSDSTVVDEGTPWYESADYEEIQWGRGVVTRDMVDKIDNLSEAEKEEVVKEAVSRVLDNIFTFEINRGIHIFVIQDDFMPEDPDNFVSEDTTNVYYPKYKERSLEILKQLELMRQEEDFDYNSSFLAQIRKHSGEEEKSLRQQYPPAVSTREVYDALKLILPKLGDPAKLREIVKSKISRSFRSSLKRGGETFTLAEIAFKDAYSEWAESIDG